MARITVEDCLENVDNRFQLVLVATKRARQLANGKAPLVPEDNDKHTVIALREIAEGLVTPAILDEDDTPNELDAFGALSDDDTIGESLTFTADPDDEVMLGAKSAATEDSDSISAADFIGSELLGGSAASTDTESPMLGVPETSPQGDVTDPAGSSPSTEDAASFLRDAPTPSRFGAEDETIGGEAEALTDDSSVIGSSADSTRIGTSRGELPEEADMLQDTTRKTQQEMKKDSTDADADTASSEDFLSPDN